MKITITGRKASCGMSAPEAAVSLFASCDISLGSARRLVARRQYPVTLEVRPVVGNPRFDTTEGKVHVLRAAGFVIA